MQAGVEVAACLQVEQLAHVLAGGVLEGGGLDNGDLPGLAVAGGVAPLDADGFDVIAHIFLPFCFIKVVEFGLSFIAGWLRIAFRRPEGWYCRAVNLCIKLTVMKFKAVHSKARN